MTSEDYEFGNLSAHYDGTDDRDDDLHDAGEHPALSDGSLIAMQDRVNRVHADLAYAEQNYTFPPDTDAERLAAVLARTEAACTPAQEYRLGVTQEAAEMAVLEHARLRDAVLAWREVDRVETPGSPAWWPAVYALRDIADRIAGEGL